MTNLQINTDKIKECGEDMVYLVKELNEQFDSLFSRISNMNTRTYEWVGSSSLEYIRRVNLEKAQYKKITNTLKEYGNVLIDAADSFDYAIRRKR